MLKVINETILLKFRYKTIVFPLKNKQISWNKTELLRTGRYLKKKPIHVLKMKSIVFEIKY